MGAGLLAHPSGSHRGYGEAIFSLLPGLAVPFGTYLLRSSLFQEDRDVQV